MSEKKLTHWKYYLHYDIIGAQMIGINEHPQKDMIDIAKALDCKILSAEPVSIGDCWLFLIRSDTPWLASKLPSYITHQGFPNSLEGKFE